MANEDIRKYYEELDTESLVKRLNSGDVSEEALSIGLEVLAKRGASTEIMAEVRESLAKEKQSKSNSRWLWLLVLLPLYLMFKYFFKQHFHM